MNKSFFSLLLVLVTVFTAFACTPITAYASESTFVTLYQNAPAQIVISEEVTLEEGLNHISKHLSSSAIQYTYFVNCKHAWVKRMDFQLGASSEKSLLDSFIGETILVVSHPGGSQSVLEGELLSLVNGQPLIKTPSGQAVLVKNPKEYRFEDHTLPQLKGKLIITLSSEKQVRTELTTGYHLQGLTWSPHYAGFLDEDNHTLSLQGIAYITNKTDQNLESSTLNLLAGSPQRETNQGTRFALAASPSSKAASAPEQVFEYYKYPITFPVDIAEDANLQISFLEKESVRYEKEYRYVPSNSRAVESALELTNTEESGLGLPLARGPVRIYNDDNEKTFVGADTIANTPVGDDIRLNLGDAFDVQGDRTRKRHQKIADRNWEDEIEIELTNRKKDSISIKVIENIPGSWRILNSSHKFEVVNDNRVQFDLEVSADQTVTISYTVRYEY